MKYNLRKEIVSIHEGKELMRIFQLSDLHFKLSSKISNQIIESVANELPDLILLTGDYFDIPKGFNLLFELFPKLAAYCPVIFIEGNHDNLYGNQFLKRLGNLANCTYLKTQSFHFKSKRGFNYTIYPENGIVKEEEKNHTNIRLIHNPRKINFSKTNHINLILCGHLHGGQFIFWKSKSEKLYPGSFFYKHCIDRKKIENSTVIISKGLGDTLPIRYNCPKEIVDIQII